MERNIIPIIVLGASAGGLEAFEKFFLATPNQSGFAFIVIAHLSPNHASILPELLQRKTHMKVMPIKTGIILKRNHVYVIPPNKLLSIKNQTLYLIKKDPEQHITLPINGFFLEVAKTHKNRVVGIILSGTGSDGTIGIRAIRNAGGLTIAEDPNFAKYNGMPNSAISSGFIDHILKPEKMFEKIIENFGQQEIRTESKSDEIPEDKLEILQQIFVILISNTGHDFSNYKEKTILRRIDRRMSVNQIDDLKDYIRFLKKNNLEIKILFKEILIGVTSFFRDPEAFTMLKNNVLLNLLRQKKEGSTIRVWIPACSTGEESYSIAIILHEISEQLQKIFEFKIFSTDIDENAINFARNGTYSSASVKEIGTERLKKYFTKGDDNKYKVSSSIREMVVFAEQNITKDPPFANLDMISCRNLLIYFNQELQRRIIDNFDYSLKIDGILFLGTSETLGSAEDFFKVIDNKWKIFQRLPLPHKAARSFNFVQPSRLSETINEEDLKMYENNDGLDYLLLVESILKLGSNPPCVVIDQDRKIHYIHGNVSRFMQPPSGRPVMNILEMARTGLKMKLASAITSSIKNKIQTEIKGLKIRFNGSSINLDLSVKPFIIPKYRSDLLVVFFEETLSTKGKKDEPLTENELIHNQELKEELAFTTEKLQITIEELQSSNEELKSSNEELQSTNEELQSSNEELETSKEELQSMNEESSTLNNELQARIESLALSNDDMKNLLDSSSVAVIFLDMNLELRRFTPKTSDIFPLKKGDEGRHITDFSSILIKFDIEKNSKLVLDDLSIREWEVKTTIGKYYYVKIRPYRTTKNVIDGIVITFEDISNLKITEYMARLSIVLQDSNDAISLINQNGDILGWNSGAEKLYGYSEKEALKMNYKELISSKSKRDLNKQFDQIINIKESESIKAKRSNKVGKQLEVFSTISTLSNEKTNSEFIAITEMEISLIKEIVN